MEHSTDSIGCCAIAQLMISKIAQYTAKLFLGMKRFLTCDRLIGYRSGLWIVADCNWTTLAGNRV